MNPEEKKDWTPEPFPEPRTIPKGWDSSALSDDKTNPEEVDSPTEWEPDPFPEPRMFPWDNGK